MTLNASGQISLGGSTSGQSVNLELGQTATTQISFSNGIVRLLSGNISGNNVSMSNFWGKTYTPPISNFLYDAAKGFSLNQQYVAANDTAGVYYVVGIIQNTTTYASYGIVQKFNNKGVLQWYKIYQNSTPYSPVSVIFSGGQNVGTVGKEAAVDNSGNLYITGVATPSGGTKSFVFVAKIDSSGNNTWTTRIDFGGSYTSDLIGVRSLALDSSGNVIIHYRALGTLGQGTSSGLMKFNSSGTRQWAVELQEDTTLNLNAYTGYTSMITDSSGNIYISGQATDSTYSPVINGRLPTVAKFDSSGNLLWCKAIWSTTINSGTYSGSYGWAHDLAVTSGGRLYVSGRIRPNSYSQNLDHGFVAELNPSTGAVLSSFMSYWATSSSISGMIKLTVDSSGDLYAVLSNTDSTANVSKSVAKITADLSTVTWARLMTQSAYVSFTTYGLARHSNAELIGNSFIICGPALDSNSNPQNGVAVLQLPIDGSLTGNKIFSTLANNGYVPYSAYTVPTSLLAGTLAASSVSISTYNTRPAAQWHTVGVSTTLDQVTPVTLTALTQSIA